VNERKKEKMVEEEYVEVDAENIPMQCTSCGKEIIGLLCPYCYRLHSIDEDIAIYLENKNEGKVNE
jgi:hypothetical protein